MCAALVQSVPVTHVIGRPRSMPRFALFALAALFAGCGEKAPAGAPSGGMPPAEVAIVTVAAAPLGLSTELPARVEASRVAQVRARVAGIVQQRVFTEGSQVKAGAVLFRIDPAAFKATFESTQAAVAKAEANLAQATLKVQRYSPLVKTNAISKQEFDDALTAQKQVSADLASAKAARQSAGLNLGYATVTAPISGRIGRAQVTEGALVGQGEATPLAIIQQVDPVYVNMTQSSTDALKLQRAIASGKLQSAGTNQAKVMLTTEDGKPYAQVGKLLFTDLSVDESSGAINLRAEFANPERLLLPGMYVRARLEQAIEQQAITIPQQAVQRGPQGANVLLVDADNKVVMRPVKADTAQGNVWIVSDGLKNGDRVIVEGFQRAKPGATVKPVAWPGPNRAAPATGAPTSASAPSAPSAAKPQAS